MLAPRRATAAEDPPVPLVARADFRHLPLNPSARVPTGPPIATARIAAVGKDAPWQDDVPELQQTLR